MKKKSGQLITKEDLDKTIDWKKYSNLKNFEVIEEDERFDPHLTKINPGLHVTSKKTVYRFKGYEHLYIVMEDGPSSIRRAQQKLRKL